MRLHICLYHLFDYNNSSRVVLLYTFVIDNYKSFVLLRYIPFTSNHYDPVVPSCGENWYYTASPFLTNCWSIPFFHDAYQLRCFQTGWQRVLVHSSILLLHLLQAREGLLMIPLVKVLMCWVSFKLSKFAYKHL